MKYITGPVVGINFHDEETGYSILRMKRTNGDPGFVSVKGYFFDAPNSLGRFIKATGKSNGPDEFQADVIYPPVLEKVKIHLEDLFDGKTYPSLSTWSLKALKAAYGEGWQDALLSDADPFSRTAMKPQAQQAAARAWRSSARRLRPYAILRNLGFSHRQAMNTVESLGAKADHKFFRRPYLLKLVSGVGFDKIDEIACGIGVNPNSMQRKQQHIINIVERLQGQGNTYIDLKRVCFSLNRYLDISVEEVEDIIRTKGIMDYRMYQLPEIGKFAAKASAISMAKQIAEQVDRIHRSPVESGFRFPDYVSDFPLDDLQEKAIKTSCLNKLSIITGGPGTGKTTIIREVVNALRHNNPDERVAYCALSGKAARRLSESTGESASTINSLLKMKPGHRPGQDELKKLEVETLIIDELSMVDEEMLLDLLRAIPEGCRLVLAGDIDQLASIGAGAVMRDLITSNVLPTTRLLKSNRFDDDSAIGIAARKINSGQVPNFSALSGDVLTWNSEVAIDKIADKVIHEVKHLIDKGISPDEIQVLTPQVGSEAGTTRLNRLLKPLMNPEAKGSGINFFGVSFHAGDRVMQSGSNDYELNFLNGDVGKIESFNLNPENGKEKTVNIRFKDERGLISVPFSKMGTVKHSYAMTIHKSQGSESENIVIPVCQEHQSMLDKQLIYTAITRTKKRIRFVGNISVLAKCLKQTPRKTRNTLLAYAVRKKIAGTKRRPEKEPSPGQDMMV